MRLGRYELLYHLATGGMGDVFVARRKGPGKIEKRVVIKRIRRELSGDPRFVEMFLREARVSMTLSHKNIAAVFDFGRVGPELFLAMEHVNGRDLGRALRAARQANKPLSAPAAAHIGIEVCRALAYAHTQASGDLGLVHRDLSPKNLLLSFSGEVVVADFGLAIESKDTLEAHGIQGTPAYLSPEQARGEVLDARSDLYSLALVLREIVTGKKAYEGDSPLQLIEAARRAELKPLDDSIPKQLRNIINKATASSPDDRYSSAQEMQEALDEYMIRARADGAPQPYLEISTWLHSLFDENEPSKNGKNKPFALEGISEESAVTVLDDGEAAVVARIRNMADASMISMAATMADAELNALARGKDLSADGTGERSVGHAFRAFPRSPWRVIIPIVAVVLFVGSAFAFVLDKQPSAGKQPSADKQPSAGKQPSADKPIPESNTAPVPHESTPLPTDAGLPPRAVNASTHSTPKNTKREAVDKPTRPGWLRVQSQPWARVDIRGSSGCSETPCRVRLPPGKHTIRLKNPVTGASKKRKVTIRSGETIDISVNLTPPKTGTH